MWACELDPPSSSFGRYTGLVTSGVGTVEEAGHVEYHVHLSTKTTLCEVLSSTLSVTRGEIKNGFWVVETEANFFLPKRLHVCHERLWDINATIEKVLVQKKIKRASLWKRDTPSLRRRWAFVAPVFPRFVHLIFSKIFLSSRVLSFLPRGNPNFYNASTVYKSDKETEILISPPNQRNRLCGKALQLAIA